MRSVPCLSLVAALALLPGALHAESAPAPTPAAAPAAAAAKPVVVKELSGFGKAPFAMRWEKVRALYPQAKEIPDGKDLGATPLGLPFVHRLVLEEQPVEGLAKPTTVELRFWKKKLWGFIVYFGANTDADVIAMLNQRLGPQDGTEAAYPLWKRANTQTTADLKQRWYGVNDLPLSAPAQAWFSLLLTGQWGGATQAELDEIENRTPAPATPAAK
jgi:hypothetical protein